MTRTEAIRLYCLDCSGGSPKEVTLCVIGDCPLYPFRFGNSPDTNGYKRRMNKAKENYPQEWAEVIADHPSVANISKSNALYSGVFRGKRRNPAQDKVGDNEKKE